MLAIYYYEAGSARTYWRTAFISLSHALMLSRLTAVSSCYHSIVSRSTSFFSGKSLKLSLYSSTILQKSKSSLMPASDSLISLNSEGSL